MMVEFRKSPGLSDAVIVNGRLIGHMRQWLNRAYEPAMPEALFIPVSDDELTVRLSDFTPRELRAWARDYASAH